MCFPTHGGYKMVNRTCLSPSDSVWQGPMCFPAHLAWALLFRKRFLHCTETPAASPGVEHLGSEADLQCHWVWGGSLGAQLRTKLSRKVPRTGMIFLPLACAPLAFNQQESINEPASVNSRSRKVSFLSLRGTWPGKFLSW